MGRQALTDLGHTEPVFSVTSFQERENPGRRFNDARPAARRHWPTMVSVLLTILRKEPPTHREKSIRHRALKVFD